MGFSVGLDIGALAGGAMTAGEVSFKAIGISNSKKKIFGIRRIFRIRFCS